MTSSVHLIQIFFNLSEMVGMWGGEFIWDPIRRLGAEKTLGFLGQTVVMSGTASLKWMSPRATCGDRGGRWLGRSVLTRGLQPVTTLNRQFLDVPGNWSPLGEGFD